MKKILVILVLVIVLFSVCACSYVPSTRFMSRSQVNSLVKQYPNPQAEMTLSYENDNYGVKQKFTIVITYDLLLDQAPLAVIRFIKLANDGAYDGTIIDTYNSSTNYMLLGRYFYEGNEKFCYPNNNLNVRFKGEFASNNYREPDNGFAEFKSFSLAMYHDDYIDEKNANFDTANGALILATNTKTLNYKNYAVFAHLASMTYTVSDKSGDKTLYQGSKVDSDARTNLVTLADTRTSSRKIYSDVNKEKELPSFSMVNTIITVQIRMLGDYDWSKLPRIGR